MNEEVFKLKNIPLKEVDAGFRKIIADEINKNSEWPFEPGYLQMEPDEQLASRIRVLTGWYDRGNYEDFVTDRVAFLRAAVLFLEYYIKGWDGNHHWFNRTTPEMHYRWLYEVSFPKTAIGAFRSAAKSTILGMVLPMFIALTRPNTTIHLVLINRYAAQERGRKIMRQFESNVKLLVDFGQLRPGRGKKVWNTLTLELPNGSVIEGKTVKSALRGGRPDWFILDDPEKDAVMKNPELLREFRSDFLNVMLPTLDPNRHFTWIGTLINVRALLYKIIHGKDAQFKNWNKLYIDLLGKDEEGNVISAWPSKYPPEHALMMLEGGSADGKVVGVGRSTFMAEYMNNPIPDEAYSFQYDPVVHTYTVEKIDNIWYRRYHEDVEDYQKWLKSLKRVMAVDPAYSTAETADYTAIVVCGLDTDGVLWVLEYVNNRLNTEDTVKEILRLVNKFRVEVVGIEANALQKKYAAQLKDEYEQLLAKGKAKHIPAFKPLVCQRKDKGQRIESLEWRFTANKIRLRGNSGNLKGMDELENQIMFFTPNLRGLEHDDLLDCLAKINRLFLKVSVSKTMEEAREFAPYGLELISPEELREYGFQERWISAEYIPDKEIRKRLKASVKKYKERFSNEPLQMDMALL